MAADRADLRRTHPGVMHFLVWKAIEIAIAEGMSELDLGGADLPGARSKPAPGEPMHGVMAFKESFGCRWIELAGNHERRLRPVHYLAGRAAERVLGAPDAQVHPLPTSRRRQGLTRARPALPRLGE